jgi:hypothetical protein
MSAEVMAASAHGVSTRKVDDLVAALGLDAGIYTPKRPEPTTSKGPRQASRPGDLVALTGLG